MKAPARSFLLLSALTLAGALPARAGIVSPRLLARIARETPPPEFVSSGEQMRTAQRDVDARPGAQFFWGRGTSMEPVYAPNTALVVQPIAYGHIRRGMTLVYRKHNGQVVAHSVVDEDRRGYVVQGVNNPEADAESVNERNLIGVVVAAYAVRDTRYRPDAGARYATTGPVPLGEHRG